MSKAVEIRVLDHGTIDDLYLLRAAVNDEFELRGSSTLVAKQTDHTLGAVAEVLEVLITPGGAAAILAQVLIVWIRQRHSKVSLRLKRADGTEIELNADRIKRADTLELRKLTSDVAAMLEGGE